MSHIGKTVDKYLSVEVPDCSASYAKLMAFFERLRVYLSLRYGLVFSF